jgi:DNA repair exonuclease SbcCD ATPase subunit
MEQDFLKLQDKAAKQQTNLSHTIEVTDNARNAYVDHLRATLRKYGSNIKSLGALANVDVDVEYPILREDDSQIERAELKVRFNFDEKGFIGMDDGEASGGQQVIKSLILLMGTMMDASSARGKDDSRGFISVDEPFAHLDIFNIDVVASFLTATGAQVIITAPSTNNVNVFRPSDIVVATSKKKSDELWAQPPAVIKRRIAKEAA